MKCVTRIKNSELKKNHFREALPAKQANCATCIQEVQTTSYKKTKA